MSSLNCTHPALLITRQALARLRGKISPKHYEVFEELERMRKANEEKVLRDIRAGNFKR